VSVAGTAWRTALVYVLIAVTAAALSAGPATLLIALIDWATHCRLTYDWLPLCLPLGGALLGLVLTRAPLLPSAVGERLVAALGLPVRSQAQAGQPAVSTHLPVVLVPTILLGASCAHLFGASVGREGAAAQMGACLTQSALRAVTKSSRFASLRTLLDAAHTKRLAVLCGVASGFAAVFGTPLAAAVFALELAWCSSPNHTSRHRKLRASAHAAPWSLLAALLANPLALALGVHHSKYPGIASVAMTLRAAGAWLLLAVCVGCLVRVFVTLTQQLKRVFVQRAFKSFGLPARMAFGGTLVLMLTLLLRSRAFLGLGVPDVLAAFDAAHVQPWHACLSKLAATAISISAGFPGGEVTPLFFIGATAGHTLAAPLGLPVVHATGVSMVATFGAAAKAPLALAVMAAELFGIEALGPALLVCMVARVASGNGGIYSQVPRVRTVA
jgi:H+/Cl- antiporter ClcA